MPRIRFKGIKKEKIEKFSSRLIDDLQKIIGCPREYFVVEISRDEFISHTETIEETPFVEILLFDRGDEVEQKIVTVVDELIKSEGYKTNDIYFISLDKKKYYEDGQHF